MIDPAHLSDDAIQSILAKDARPRRSLHISLRLDVKAALDLYATNRSEPGGFLVAVLSNDLFRAVSLADLYNRESLHLITAYIYNQLPASSWGSPSAVKAWLTKGELPSRI